MREIIFKAKRIGESEWVQGNVFFAENGLCEICIGTPVVRITYEVDPSTVCQYTGLEDMNGVKIFEGDLVSFENSDGEKTIYSVEWIDNGWYVCCKESHYPDSDPDELDFIFAFSCVVIGNIHDRETSDTYIPSNSEGREKLGNLRNAF